MTRLMLVTTLFASVLVATSPLVAETHEETIEKTLPFAAGKLLELTNTNGDVEISAWDRDEIEIIADKKVRGSGDKAREAFEELEVVIDESASGVTVTTEYPKSRGSWFGGISTQVSYTIRLPRRADLDLGTVNGNVKVEGVHGELDLNTTNGGIRVLDAGGSLTARTTNGSIDCELREVTADEDMKLRTTNGGITLSLPADIQATLSARTTNGSVSTDFPVTVQGTFRKNRLEGDLNGGGPPLDLSTTNGSIKIREI